MDHVLCSGALCWNRFATCWDRFGLGPSVSMKGNHIARAYKEILNNCLLPSFTATVWGRPTYKCDDQVFTYIWTYSIHQVFKINLPKTKTMEIGPINIIHTANSFTQMFSKNCHFSINSISLSPILVNIKDKLLRRGSKPIKWLGRICMPKINIIPRLRYPLKMLSVTGNCFVSKEKIFPTRQALLWFPLPCTQ